MIKTYEGFLDNIFKKPAPKSEYINIREKIENFLNKTSVEDVKYLVCDITDELGTPREIAYFLEMDCSSKGYGTYRFNLVDNGKDRFQMKNYNGGDEILDRVPNFAFSINSSYCSFCIEFISHENSNYDISTDSDNGDRNYEVMKDFCARIMDEYEFREYDFQYLYDKLKLIFKF